jgi:hypothetical protein
MNAYAISADDNLAMDLPQPVNSYSRRPRVSSSSALLQIVVGWRRLWPGESDPVGGIVRWCRGASVGQGDDQGNKTCHILWEEHWFQTKSLRSRLIGERGALVSDFDFGKKPALVGIAILAGLMNVPHVKAQSATAAMPKDPGSSNWHSFGD